VDAPDADFAKARAALDATVARAQALNAPSVPAPAKAD